MSAVPTDPGLRRVGLFWALYQARQWAGAEALLHPQASCRWRVTRERFDGAAGIVQVNAAYPEGWTIYLLELHRLAPDLVLSLVRVDQGGRSFWAHSHFRFDEEWIAQIDEYWCDAAEPPAWRAGLSGRTLIPADARPGLTLDPALWA